MKYFVPCILLAALLVGGNLSAQNSKKQPAATETPKTVDPAVHYRKVFVQAVTFNDLSVATDAIYNLLSLGEAHAHYLDTLALIYFQRAAWPQVANVTTTILKKTPEAEGPLELRAVAFQTMGMAKESLEDYEKLYGITKNAYHLYEIAALQFAMRRFGECDQSLGRLMNDPSVKDKVIQLNTGKQAQEVPLLAACSNMIGVLLLEQGKKEEAKLAFEAALKQFPDFVLAKNNLEETKK
jgi:tetratricopeptide (TPR) repeat protein